MNLKTYVQGTRGAQTAAARAIGCQPQLMWQWQAGVRPVPAERCAAIERATGGQVTCEELRPDLAWRRNADAGWHWHPAGRPLLDAAALGGAQPMPAESEARNAA